MPRTHEVYWTVYVVSPGDLDLGVSEHDHKFVFRGADQATRALECYEAAKAAGLVARIDKVRAYKEEKEERVPG